MIRRRTKERSKREEGGGRGERSMRCRRGACARVFLSCQGMLVGEESGPGGDLARERRDDGGYGRARGEGPRGSTAKQVLQPSACAVGSSYACWLVGIWKGVRTKKSERRGEEGVEPDEEAKGRRGGRQDEGEGSSSNERLSWSALFSFGSFTPSRREMV
jgi:hypothetical protein